MMRYPGLSPAQRHGGGLSRCGAGEVYSLVTSDRSCVLVPTRAFRGSHGAAELCLRAPLRFSPAFALRVAALKRGSPGSCFSAAFCLCSIPCASPIPSHLRILSARRRRVAASTGLFPVSFPSPNECLTLAQQRTAPGVTVAASSLRLSPAVQLPRRPPLSLCFER